MTALHLKNYCFVPLANNFYNFGAFDMAASAFSQGREILGDHQLFTFELLSIYRFKKDSTKHLLRPYNYAIFSAAADIKSPNYLKT